MRKPKKFIILFAMSVLLFSPHALAKNEKYNPPNFLKFTTLIDEKHENPKLKEKLSKIKKSKSGSQNSDTVDEFKKYDLKGNKRNLSESCFAWLAIISVCMIIIKVICANFRIPFDYDPNFENKYVPRRKSKNKKYNF